MRGEIIIQQYLPNNLQIICRTLNALKRMKQKKQKVANLRYCSYREFAKVKVDQKRPCSYRYIKHNQIIPNNESMSQCEQNSIINPLFFVKEHPSEDQTTKEEETTKYGTTSQLPKSAKCKKKEQKMKMLNDPVSLNLLSEYRNLCAHNIMKNIKEGFIRQILSTKSPEQMEYFEKLIENQATFQQIKRKVKPLKNSQDNKAIKIICKHPLTQIIFKNFLEHAEEDWLACSKIKEKDKCIKMVRFLIKIIEQIEFIDVIENYSKK